MITSCVINFVMKLHKQRCVYFLATTVTCIHYVTGLTWPLNPESSSSSYLTFLSCLLIFEIIKSKDFGVRLSGCESLLCIC